jgi:hypothetical protein
VLGLIPIAKDDSMLLAHTEKRMPISSKSEWFQHIFAIQDAICIIQVLQMKLACGLDEKTLANLEYLLLRYRGNLIQREMMHGMHHFLDKFINRPLQGFLKYGGSKWCSEYSNSKPPASTTWPWSIKPSLAVIWGVCWQFTYDSANNWPGQLNARSFQTRNQHGKWLSAPH